jgi:hypothetical protein
VHASVFHRKKLFVDWVPASDLEDTTAKEVCIKFLHLSLYIILIFTLFHNMTKKLLLQNPDAYKAAWKLLKVCLFDGLGLSS